MQHLTEEVRRKHGSMRHNNIHKEEECKESNLERQENTAEEILMVHGDSMLIALSSRTTKNFCVVLDDSARNKCFSSMMSNKENM